MIPSLIMSLVFCSDTVRGEAMPMRLCIPAAQAAIAEYETEEKRIQFLRGYRYGALKATIVLSNKSSLDKENTPFASGYRSGKIYAGEKAKTKQPLGLSEFSYEIVTLEGIMRLGPEQSHLHAKGQDRPYWIVFPDFRRSKIPKGTWPKGKFVRVKGWLSPRGTYGHMGLATHEFIVIEISENAKETKQDASVGHHLTPSVGLLSARAAAENRNDGLRSDNLECLFRLIKPRSKCEIRGNGRLAEGYAAIVGRDVPVEKYGKTILFQLLY